MRFDWRVGDWSILPRSGLVDFDVIDLQRLIPPTSKSAFLPRAHTSTPFSTYDMKGSTTMLSQGLRRLGSTPQVGSCDHFDHRVANVDGISDLAYSTEALLLHKTCREDNSKSAITSQGGITIH